MNLDALRKRFAELDSRNKKGGKAVWKPEAEHNVRCLQLPEGGDGEDLGKEVYWHYGIGKYKKVYCPKNDGNECAICDFAAVMKDWNGPDGKEKPKAQREADFQIFRTLEAGPKHYVPIIVRKSETGDDFEGPFWWEMSPTVYKALFSICLNEDWNSDHADGGGLAILTSREHGRDVKVKFMKPGAEGNTTSYNKVTVEERKKTRPLLVDRKQSAALGDKIPSLADAARPLSSAEIQKIFDESFSGDEVSKSSGVEHGADSEPDVQSHNAEKLDGKSSVEEGLDKLKKLINSQEK